MHVMGVDLGSSSLKAVLFEATDAGMRAVARAAIPVRVSVSAPGVAELDAERLAEDAIELLAAAAREAPPPAAIGFSAAMHSLLALGADGHPRHAAITWADQRAAPHARRRRSSPTARAVAFRTGTPIHAMTPREKLAWMREEAPQLFGGAARFTGAKEYVLDRLTRAEAVMDLSMASGTGLCNLWDQGWDETLVEEVGVAGRLPRIVSTTARRDALNAEVRRRTGLPRDAAVIVGGGDGPLSNLGVGAVAPGIAAVSIGTSGAVRVATAGPAPHPEGRTFAYHLCAGEPCADDDGRGLWVAGGAISNGTLVVNWLRDRLGLAAAEPGLEALLAEAATVPAGAEGLLFLPYLAGERAPHWNDDDSGALLGMRLSHGRAHLVRAAMEGVAFAIRDVLESLPPTLPPVCAVRATGGFTGAPLWVQILADVLDRPVAVMAEPEGGALGAALLAYRALDPKASLTHMAGQIEVRETYPPAAAARAVYDDAFGRYREAYASAASVKFVPTARSASQH